MKKMIKQLNDLYAAMEKMYELEYEGITLPPLATDGWRYCYRCDAKMVADKSLIKGVVIRQTLGFWTAKMTIMRCSECGKENLIFIAVPARWQSSLL